MPTFSYKAINEVGVTLTGTMEAESPDQANASLMERGYIPVRVREERAAGSVKWEELSLMFASISTAELILFTKQFRTMLRAGIPILTLLQTMELQSDNPLLKKTVARVAEDIKGGASLHEALRKHPKVCSPLYCSMVRSGETAGALPDVLERLTYILEHEHKVKSDVKAAMFYPLIVICFLSVAFIVLLTFVIPKFADIFLQAGIDLPLPTRICIAMYNFLANYWHFLSGGLALAAVLLWRYFKTDPGKLARDTWLLKIPLIGKLMVKGAMSRFASIFAILQASGVSVLESIQILINTIGNAAIAREFTKIREKLEEGRGIAGPLKAARYFPPMVINMIAIGEESGNLDEMLREISNHYDYEVEYATKQLSDALGPILTLALAGVVGFFALAIFLPMWDLTKMVR